MTHVAFLRAVNVGGRGLIRMTDLRQAFVAAGARDVRTVIASGNVVFDGPPRLGALRQRIHANVRKLLGAEPVIMFRTMQYLNQLVEAEPFGARVNDRLLKLYVGFLAGTPKQLPTFPFTVPRELLEIPGMHEQDVLIVSRRKPNGMYGYPGLWTDQEMGVASTTRNWSTVVRITRRPA